MSGFTHSPESSPQLRQQYLKSLEEPQEFFLEEMVGLGEFWANDDGSYGVINGTSLVEFFSFKPENSTRLLRSLHDQLAFSTALVKSFDPAFMQSCHKLGWQGTVGGFLFRSRKSHTHITFNGAEISAAIPTDVEALWEINEDFFESQGEIAALASKGKLWTASVDGEIVGCGVSNRFIEDSDAADIGMMVAPNFRRRGLGTHIVSEIANKTEQCDLRPICGCGASNTASKATLEKAGFVSEHQLISFTV